MSRKPSRLRARRPWARIVQSSAFVRKELVEIIRQPRLLALLVVGPFLLLLLFGAGYRNDDLRMRTTFVGPAGSFYEDAVNEYQEVLDQYVRSEGFTSDEAAAREALADGEVDAVVVFPADPLADVLAGEQAEVLVLHDKLDPIQQTAVDIASRLAVQEVNARVVATFVAGGQQAIAPLDDVLATLASAGSNVAAAVAAGDETAAASAAGEVAEAAARARELVATSDTVLGRLGAEDVGLTDDADDALARVQQEATAIASGGTDLTARADALAGALATVAEAAPELSSIDPAVLVRPFRATTESIAAVDIEPADYFTPSALALLLQHLAVTFAALSLVRDRHLGLFELLRVGPLSSWEIVSGKTIAYLTVGMIVGVGLFEAAVQLLGVPMLGSIMWVLGSFALVLLASLALGTLVSLISSSETQAVQWAMLTLLAGLFFSGFVLSLDGMTYPVKAISWVLPVTYGIRILQDVMLRGIAPATDDLVGLGALVLVYGGIAILLLRRQLRTA